MKKILSLFLVVTLLSSFALFTSNSTVAQATEITSNNVAVDNGFKYIVKEDNTVEISAYSGSETSINIPEKINNMYVTSVGTAAFYNSKTTQITLPDTVTTIGWWAFYGCKLLENVQFGNSITTICYGAFMNCSSLRSASLPMSINKIEADAFAVSCTTNKNVNDIYSGLNTSFQKYTVDNTFTIEGYAGTYAQNYADDNSLVFNNIGRIMFGDVNCDGHVDETDVDELERIIQSQPALSQIKMRNSDVDLSGTLTENDVTLIKSYIENKMSYYGFSASQSQQPQTDYLNGKTLYADGDSITKGYGTNIFGSGYYSYANYLEQTYNMQLTNKAVSGTTLAKQASKTTKNTKSILERIQQMQGSYDAIVIDGGFNDVFQNIEIGSITPQNSKSGVYNEYTTTGALESICYFLTKNYPDAKKLFVLCHKRNASPTQSQYWDAITKVLEKWEINYIDFSKETSFSDVNDEITSQYFVYNSLTKSGDGTHPLKYANEKIYGPLVAEKLNSLFADQSVLSLSESSLELGVSERCSLQTVFSQQCNNPQLKWTSDDSSVAAVDENGVVYAKKIGTTTIRVTTSDNKTASCKVDVRFMALCLSLNTTELDLTIGQSFDLDSSLLKGTASHQRYYTSSNPQVASVTKSYGIVTAQSSGTATITCIAYNGAKAECTVTVN